MAVRRAEAVDERGLFAEYPFLPGAESLVEELAPSLKDVLGDASYARARELGRARVRAAVDDPTGGSDLAELARATREERFLSFLYARLLLSGAPIAAPLRRWAVAEAKRSWRQLEKTSPEVVAEVARRLGFGFEAAPDGIRIPLTDYLHLATSIREADFRLVRQAVKDGVVHVTAARATRLLQEGVRLRLTQPIALAPDVRGALAGAEAELLEEVARRVPGVAASSGPKGPVRPELFPPCIRRMRRALENGENLSHSGRFALAAFLHKVGADFDAIVDAYRGAPDFDETITRYQVEHITRRDEGRGYEPPTCDTLRSHGLCVREGDPTAPLPIDKARDERCFDSNLRHPVQYYRWRGGAVTPRAGSEGPEGPGTRP